MSFIVCDVETCALDNAQDYLEPCQPDSRLVDPKKIAASIQERTEERNSRLGLDHNVGRICAMGWWGEWFHREGEPSVYPCHTWEHEAEALDVFWSKAKNHTIVGFNIKEFDLPYMIQRSRYLRVPYPQLDLSPWKRSVIDLYSELTFGKPRDDKACMRRTLKAFCKRFGIPVDDTIQGKDIPALVAAGRWDEIVSHVKSDVELTVALAREIGVIPKPVQAVGAF